MTTSRSSDERRTRIRRQNTTTMTTTTTTMRTTSTTEAAVLAPAELGLTPPPPQAKVYYQPELDAYHDHESNMRKRDFQDINPPRTEEEFYAHYDPTVGITTFLMLGSFLVLITINATMKFYARQMEHRREKKRNPELYNVARNWDGRIESLLNTELSLDNQQMISMLQDYQAAWQLEENAGRKISRKQLAATKKAVEKPVVEKPAASLRQVRSANMMAGSYELPADRLSRSNQSLTTIGVPTITEEPADAGEDSDANAINIKITGPTPATTPSSIHRYLDDGSVKPAEGDASAKTQNRAETANNEVRSLLISAIAEVHNSRRRRLPSADSTDSKLSSTSASCSSREVLATATSDSQSFDTALEDVDGEQQAKFLALPSTALVAKHGTGRNSRLASSSSDPCKYLETDL